jgi:hypothetical protein
MAEQLVSGPAQPGATRVARAATSGTARTPRRATSLLEPCFLDHSDSSLLGSGSQPALCLVCRLLQRGGMTSGSDPGRVPQEHAPVIVVDASYGPGQPSADS